MLRLEKMEVCGFKSFGDRTEIRFREGITAIVGPNGCGKSNIGDAINWVLGEQSAKNLRGHQMADVIFSGSEARKALGMAEVSLVFAGAPGLPMDDQGHVVVTRRLFRSGESEYNMNGSRTRLKDIQEMLRQARVGARTYATIEQGKIDQVLNAKPRDRRALIEDAAGIAGYKHKRRLAELKLEATHANLLRVNDIVVEVTRQINSVKRQAAKARRYRRLRDELRAKELVRFAGQAREMERELARLRKEEGEARSAEAEASARLSGLEADLLSRREALDELNRQCREAADRVHQLDIEIDREESQILACRERIAESSERAQRHQGEAQTLVTKHEECIERARVHQAALEEAERELEQLTQTLGLAQAGLEQAEREQRELREELERQRERQFEAMAAVTELRNRIRGTEEALGRTLARRDRLVAEQAAARRAWDDVRSEADRLALESKTHGEELEQQRVGVVDGEAELVKVRQRHAAEVQALASGREAEKSALARLATLEDVETRFAGVSDGVKRLLRAGGAIGVRTHGVVADYVQASQEIEGAAEGYLQWLLPTVILEDDADTCRAAEFLRGQGAGPTSLICRTQPTGSFAVGTAGNGRGKIPREILRDGRVLGQLRDRLTMKPSANGAVSERIGDAVLVDSLNSALDLHRRFPAADYVTPEGEVVYASGVISAGGRPAGDRGLLAHKRRMDQAQAEAAAASRRVEELQDRVDTGRREVSRLEDQAVSRRERLEQAERRGVELRLRVERSEEEAERSGRQSAVLTEEIESLQAEASGLEQSRDRMMTETRQAEEQQIQLGQRLRDCADRLARGEATLKEQLSEVTDLRADQAAKQQRLETTAQEGDRLAEAAADLRARLDGLLTDAAAAQSRAEASREQLERTETELADHLEQRRLVAADVGKLEQEVAQRRDRLAADEASLGSIRVELETLRNTTREAELARTRGEAAREHLDDLCRQELGQSATEAEQSAGDGAEAIELESLEAEIEEIKGKIDRIGPVNLTAIEEFAELEERHAFLTSQREDLDRSMESLKETIRRINRESRQRFMEAFEQIRVSYQEVFRSLFTGGRADLRLEEGEDVLECGIEILAQPPGKRLTGVHLLSGGEKALSAIALLFAIFRYQPSPFCLLDEVDAALDDTNVVRFAKMVGDYARNTQFVIITHNKLSMEAADLLYGVTMEEPGVSKLVSLQLS